MCERIALGAREGVPRECFSVTEAPSDCMLSVRPTIHAAVSSSKHPATSASAHRMRRTLFVFAGQSAAAAV